MKGLDRKPRESVLEKKFTDACEAEGWRVRKYTSPGHAGEPDRLVFAPGGVLALAELKREGERPTEQQKIAHSELAALGFTVMVVDNVLGIARFVERLRREVRG